MPPNDRAEFLQELEATDEAYVRRKVLLGYYEGWHLTMAQQWLAQQDSKRTESWVKSNLFWVAATGIATVCTAFIAFASPYLSSVFK